MKFLVAVEGMFGKPEDARLQIPWLYPLERVFYYPEIDLMKGISNLRVFLTCFFKKTKKWGVLGGSNNIFVIRDEYRGIHMLGILFLSLRQSFGNIFPLR
jgi:hypothetical protein